MAAAATAWGGSTNDVALPSTASGVAHARSCVAVAVLFGGLGVAIGAIARNQVAAIVAALAWRVLVEPELVAASLSVFDPPSVF